MAAFIIISAPMTSYMEAQAAEAGLWALAQLIENAMVSVGMSAAGYLRSRLSISDEDAVKAYIKAMDYGITGRPNPFLSSFLDKNGKDYLALSAKYMAGETVNEVKDGIKISGSRANGLSIGFSNNVAKCLGDAVSKYLESDKNIITVAQGKEEEGTVTVDSDYVSSITTTVTAVTSLESMDGIDNYFGIEGASAYLKSEGYSDKDYYFLIHASGSSTYIMPVPINYSVVGYRLAWGGKTGVGIMSNMHYKNAVSQCGVRDASSFSSYFNALPFYTGRFYVYSVSSGAWTVNADKNYLPGLVSSSGKYELNMGNWYFCNAENAYANGCTFSYTFFSSSMQRNLYTYKTTGNAISYDPSCAVSYPDGVTFSFSDSDVMDGLDGYDLDTLISYLSGLSEEMAEWRKQQSANQETIIEQNKEVIQQNKSLLSAVGGINSTVAKILTAINKLPASILSALTGEFMTAERLETLLNGIPVVLAGVLSDAYTDSQISVLPGILSDVLSSVFPDAASAIEALIDLPAYIMSAVSGIQVKVPDITIPDIAVPDVFVEAPVVTLNPTFDVAVPDVFVEAPAVTLNPTFDITVANDYAGLDNVISKAVEGVMADVFVPDETLTLERVGEMQEYFKFTEDMKDIISEFEKSVFGITPSPILKIPIGKTKSKKYNYGLGNYIIIDVGWYAEYKDFGDKIILAFAWAFFIWRMFVLLPGIINGTVGGFFTPERVDRMTVDAEIKKDYRQLHEMRRESTTGGMYGRFSGGRFKD